jgi:hypothetical protein
LNRNNTSKSIFEPATSTKYTGNGNFVWLNVIRFPPRSFIKLHWHVLFLRRDIQAGELTPSPSYGLDQCPLWIYHT